MSTSRSSYYANKPTTITYSRDSRDSSASSTDRYSSDSYYHSSSSSGSSMAKKDRYDSESRVEYRRTPDDSTKRIDTIHRGDNVVVNQRAGRVEEYAPSSKEAYDDYKRSEGKHGSKYRDERYR